jgi:hypothetical protein
LHFGLGITLPFIGVAVEVNTGRVNELSVYLGRFVLTKLTQKGRTALRTRLTTTEARQAMTVRGMLPVLVVSTIGAFIVLAGLYLYYFGWPS